MCGKFITALLALLLLLAGPAAATNSKSTAPAENPKPFRLTFIGALSGYVKPCG